MEISTKPTKSETITSGVFQFHRDIHPTQLIELAEEWKNRVDGHRFINLWIQEGFRGKHIIVFRYELDMETHPNKREAHEVFFYNITDELKKRFGNLFVGWDVSPVIWTIQ